MARYQFTARPRKVNSNEPLTYDIETESGTSAGALVKQKNRWRLKWLGTSATFDSKRELVKHFAVLGHQIEGLL